MFFLEKKGTKIILKREGIALAIRYIDGSIKYMWGISDSWKKIAQQVFRTI